MLHWVVGTILLAGSAGQDSGELFRKAPPEVDAALRARISKFYQAHVDGKYRLAEPLVAEDTKDFFYQANKPHYLSFAITRIDYSDNFTKAKATILGEMIIPVMGFADKPVKVPFPSTWKLESGEWFWYVDPESLNRTPFGTMKSGTAGGAGGAALPQVPQTPEAAQKTLRALWTQVKADKTVVNLRPGTSDKVTIHNGISGSISLALEGVPPKGMDIQIEPASLKSGESAVVSFTCAAGVQPAKGIFTVRVQPTNQRIFIRARVSSSR